MTDSDVYIKAFLFGNSVLLYLLHLFMVAYICI